MTQEPSQQAISEPYRSKLVGELEDPRTTADRLQQIAAEAPELGPRIVAHQNCYPELKDWVEQHAPATLPHPRLRKLWKAIGITAAVVAPLIATASITIPLIANWSERESSSSSLITARAEPAPSPFADVPVIGTVEESRFKNFYRISADAPLEEFPLPTPVSQAWGDEYSCGDEQHAWLRTHGETYDPEQPVNTFTVTLQNTATASGALALGNIRFVGEEFNESPRYEFVCNWGGRGGGTLSQMLLVGAEGEEAVYSEPVNASGTEEMPVGSPVTLNLEPGELLVITLTRGDWVDTQKSYRGKFVADVLDGSEDSVVIDENIEFHRDPLPNFRVVYGEMGNPNGNFYCKWSGAANNFGDLCTLTEAKGFLQQAIDEEP